MSKNTIALHLGGPLQSWATGALVNTRVDTDRQPKERAIRGMLAACFGTKRGEMYPPEVLKAKIEVIMLKGGSKVRDFQIISNRPGEEEYLNKIGRILKKGAKSPEKVATPENSGGNAIVRRSYLGDAKFIVLITGDNDEETETIFSALKNPVWSPYLGRKSFAPTFPFILGMVDESSAEVSARAILARATALPSELGGSIND